MKKNGLLFLNMGGPETLAEVRPFLQNLFSDGDIVPLPLGSLGMKVFGWTFAALRASASRKFYEQMGGGSPQRRLSTEQASLVAARLDEAAREHGPWKSYLAFRYTRPSTDDALRAIRADGVERLFVVPLYPHYSSVTTGSSLAELERGFARAGFRPAEVVTIESYHDDEAYLDALAGTVNRALDGLAPAHRDEATVLFSAHALPLRVVAKGDPYPAHIEATVKGAVARLAHPVDWRLVWQSQARPFVKWLEPKTDHVVRELGAAGKKTLVMVPVAFVQEHVETLYEMDKLYAGIAREAGIERFVRVPALNDDPAFIGALAGLVGRAAGIESCAPSS
jgi:ferrochelatase